MPGWFILRRKASLWRFLSSGERSSMVVMASKAGFSSIRVLQVDSWIQFDDVETLPESDVCRLLWEIWPLRKLMFSVLINNISTWKVEPIQEEVQSPSPVSFYGHPFHHRVVTCQQAHCHHSSPKCCVEGSKASAFDVGKKFRPQKQVTGSYMIPTKIRAV